jgi:uncharacterized protein (DUF433 family)
MGDVFWSGPRDEEPDWRYKSHMKRITLDPHVMGGKPCIRGMRITVDTILGLLASGQSEDRILRAYPYLEREDIQQAVRYKDLL